MGFVDEIYEMYRNQLTGSEEDAVALVLNLLEDHEKNDLLKMINQMNDAELFQMVAMYLIEILKVKMSQEDLSSPKFKSQSTDNRLH